MHTRILSPSQWGEISESAFLSSFGGERKRELDSHISHALFVTDENDVPVGYITAQIQDPTTVYWKHGGIFPQMSKTLAVFREYKKAIEWERSQKGRERIVTYIWNKNTAMLRLAMQAGFLITGTRNLLDGRVLVDHCLELNQERH